MVPATSQVYLRNAMCAPLGGISLAGVARNGRGVPIANRILNRYSLVYVFDGTGSYTDEDVRDLPIASGSLIQISPNTRHWYGPGGDRTWHEVYIIFEGPVFDVWAERGCFELDAPVKELKPIDYWRDRFITAITGGAVDEDRQMSAMSEVLRVQSLIFDIQRALAVGDDEDRAWRQRAEAILAESANARDAAEAMGVSYETFRKKFRRLAGAPPSRYHAGVMMERACDLLAHTELSVKRIARDLNYCDEFHFSRRFSHIVGCSPTTYRARTQRS